MKNLILILVLSLTTLSAKALDITTCNPELLAHLKGVSALTKEQRVGIASVNSILTYKMIALRDFAAKIKPQSDEAFKDLTNSKSATAVGKVSAYTETYKTLKAEIETLKLCNDRTLELLKPK